jgi:hypothetical protein
MKRGSIANLQMRKNLCIGSQTEKHSYKCTVLKYDEKQECLYFLLGTECLTDVSLDGIYGCEIEEENEVTSCIGRIRERYMNKQGNVLKFQIQNGFYKINLKCVDKPRA